MKSICLALICCLQFYVVQAGNGQYSKKCALIGIDHSLSHQELNDQLKQSGAFLPFNDKAILNGQYYLAWFDPASANAPQTDLELENLLVPLRTYPGIQFAEPFLEAPNGELAGLTNQVLVQTVPGTHTSDFERYHESMGISTVKEHSYLPNWLVIELNSNRSMNSIQVASLLEQESQIILAEPNLLLQVYAGTNDTYFDHQWNIDNRGLAIQGNGTPGADMSVVDAWTLSTGHSGIKLVIIDSGVDTTHPDLLDNLLPGFDATGNGSQGFPNTNFPNDGHGTACAGIAAAKGENNIGVAGVCYDCSIVPIKLFSYLFNPFGDPLPFATGDDMATAISWAWQDGNASLISNSWGLTDPLLGALPGGTGVVEAALDMALDSARGGRGVPIFFSSGNEGDPPIWPGRRAELFSVNASSMCDERKNPNSCDGEPWEGNWGDSLDVTAPGVRIPTTDMAGANGYDGTDYIFGFNGTSAACPNAAGVMGLIMSMDSTLTLDEYHTIMETTCEKVGGYNYNSTLINGSWSAEMGYGRLNAFAALQMANPVNREEIFGASHFLQVTPNPASNHLDIQCSLPYSSVIQVELINANGQISIVREWRNHQGESYRLDLADGSNFLSNGLYILKVKTSKHLLIDKILINNTL